LHTNKIRKLLSVSDFYSAECRRDYKLAKELGFSGVELPLMPNAGGFNETLIVSKKTRFRDRRTIYVKGYGLTFGLGQISLNVSRRLLDRYAHIDIVVVSVTEDLMELSAGLVRDFGSRVTIYSARKGLSHDQVIQILSSSLISIGASQSDGISTTFLESLVCGAIPVQTDTSCANEWVDKGFFARVVSPVEEAIYAACCEIISDPEGFEVHTLRNSELAIEHLSYQVLKQIAIDYYPEAVG
jgi:glycosyltransferase involved in cell wall biosynthesis